MTRSMRRHLAVGAIGLFGAALFNCGARVVFAHQTCVRILFSDSSEHLTAYPDAYDAMMFFGGLLTVVALLIEAFGALDNDVA